MVAGEDEAGQGLEGLARARHLAAVLLEVDRRRLLSGIHDQTPVAQKELDQWFIGITKYAEELLSGHKELEGRWPANILEMQRNWIGRSEGAEIRFPLAEGAGDITVFTTRPDTLFGATFMSMAPEHPMVMEFARNAGRGEEVREFVERVARQDRIERTGEGMSKEGIFTGGYCVNPVTGEKIPVYAANFVLYEYGTGAVMAVPAHDQRDFEFARRYGLPVVVVVQPEGEALEPETMAAARAGKHIFCEKPLAHSAAEAREIRELVDDRSGSLFGDLGQRRVVAAHAEDAVADHQRVEAVAYGSEEERKIFPVRG